MNLHAHSDTILGMQLLFEDHAALSDDILAKTCPPATTMDLINGARSGQVRSTDLPTVWLERFIRAMEEEIQELKEEIQWKWWRGEPTDMRKVRVELIDVFHFFLSACAAAGMDGVDIVRVYYEKRRVNFERQKEGKRTDDDIKVGHLSGPPHMQGEAVLPQEGADGKKPSGKGYWGKGNRSKRSRNPRGNDKPPRDRDTEQGPD